MSGLYFLDFDGNGVGYIEGTSWDRVSFIEKNLRGGRDVLACSCTMPESPEEEREMNNIIGILRLKYPQATISLVADDYGDPPCPGSTGEIIIRLP